MSTLAEQSSEGENLRQNRRSAARSSFLPLMLQLLLVLLVVRVFHLEERRGLFVLIMLAVIGAAIYWRLAPRWRPPFFLALSLVGFPLAFAWPAVGEVGWREGLLGGALQSAWVFGLGLALIGICHLPVPFAGQAALLAAVAAGMAAWRLEAVSPFWAILGSIFMFRLWIYWRTIGRERIAVAWTQRLSYFFMFPNGFFPFFPIVDYRKFHGCYEANETGPIAQRGIAWILRGIIHLLLYRAVKVYFLPGTMDLIDVEYLVLFLVTNYALYLRISGHFHIITGLLHLFGYNLPRTHDRYFLASSLSDIWRRINIYWKDFLTDYVFFPVFFSLRRFPKAAAVVVGVLVTFVATWFFHSWQVFWLLGDFPLGMRDGVLWLSAGTLVAINSLWQYRSALQRTPVVAGVTFGSALRLSGQVVATFLTVSFFWACWTEPHFPRLVVAIWRSGGFRADQLLAIGSVILGVIAAGTIAQLGFAALRQRDITPSFPLERSPAICVAALGLLTLVGLPQVNRHLGYEAAQEIARLQHDAPTAAELGQEIEGYYEELAEVNLQSDPLLGKSKDKRPQTETLYWDATRASGDARGAELIPGWRGEVAGVPFHINRWGMRDADTPRRKPSGTYRVAVLGSSVTMGYGVSEDADFESLLESELNADNSSEEIVELLNFAVGGYSAIQSATALREKALQFDPDAVYYVAHQAELQGGPKHLARTYKAKYPLPYPCLNDIVRQAGVDHETSWGTAELRLRSEAKRIVECVYRGIADDCRRRGILPVWIYVPIPGVTTAPIDDTEVFDLAREAGFIVIDLSDWSGSYEPSEVKLGETDRHANPLGHRLIADRLFAELQNDPKLMPP